MDSTSPRAGRPDVSVVIPAHNEASTIAEVIRRVDACLEARGWSREIIVGDSASTDDTVAEALATGLPVRVVSAFESGKGRILTRALMEARGRVLAFIDADLDLSPEELPSLIDEVLDGATCAVGAKAGEALAARPLHRRLASRVVNAAARRFLRTGISDHQTGMKAFSREPLRQVLPYVVETGWLWDTEVLWRLRRAGATAIEVPVTLLDARGSGFRGANGIEGGRQFMALYSRVGAAAGSGLRKMTTGAAAPPGDRP